MMTLGIDPGIAITGCALIEETQGKQTLVFCEEINTSKSLPTAERLRMLYDSFSKIVKKAKPDTAILESLFFNTNAKTALIVGQARGVIQLSLSVHNIPVVEYTPLQVKMALTGYGRADKNQIQQMVKNILKLPEILKPDDVADAAAIALTHCFSYKIKQITKKQITRVK